MRRRHQWTRGAGSSLLMLTATMANASLFGRMKN